MVTGSHGNYRWLVNGWNGIAHLIERCPEALLDRYLIVACCDSGPLDFNADEEAAGWSFENQLAYSPRLESLRRLPYWGFDEWYVFTSPARLCSCDIFINFGGFTLSEPEEAVTAFDPTWDRAGAKAYAEEQMRRQHQFWRQLESSGAESYIAEGDHFIFATANTSLFARVEAAFRSA